MARGLSPEPGVYDANYHRTDLDGVKGSKALAQILAERHPHYIERLATWNRFIDFYESRNLGDYIDRHERESNDYWQGRKKRIVYRNYVRKGIEHYTHYIFSKPIARSPMSKASATQKEQLEDEGQLRSRGGKVSMLQGHLDIEWQEEFLNNC